MLSLEGYVAVKFKKLKQQFKIYMNVTGQTSDNELKKLLHQLLQNIL